MSEAPTTIGIKIGDRLREERVRLGMNQAEFAKAVGVAKTTQSNYEGGGRSPDALYLHAAELLGISTAYVVTGARPGGTSDNFVTIPVLALQASAGNGTVNEPQSSYRVAGMSVSRDFLQRRHLNPNSLVAIKVRGHSMEGVLSDGDQVLVNTADTTVRTGFVYVLLQGDELLVKHCQLLPGGMLRVTSANANFPPYDVDLSQTDDVKIIGRVVASMHEW